MFLYVGRSQILLYKTRHDSPADSNDNVRTHIVFPHIIHRRKCGINAPYEHI